MLAIILIFTYVFSVNVAAFVCYSLDKYWAITANRRIPESLLLGLSVAGGAYGAGMGMLLFHHKTQHRKFLAIIPICFVLWLVVLVILCLNSASLF